MKKPLFHFIRYGIILFPILFLIIVLAHTNYYTDYNKTVATNYPTEPYQYKEKLALSKFQNLVDLKGPKIAVNQITTHHKWKIITHQIATGNNQWASIIPDILPYMPMKIRTKLNQAIAQALLVKPDIVLQSLALTYSTLQNTKMICKANNISLDNKLYLAAILHDIHNPSFIYQQQICLQTLLKTITQAQQKLS